MGRGRLCAVLIPWLAVIFGMLGLVPITQAATSVELDAPDVISVSDEDGDANKMTVRAVEARRADVSVTKAEPVPPAAAAPAAPLEPVSEAARPEASDAAALKAALLEELKKTKKFFYGTVIAQAQKIEIEGDRLVLAFAPGQGALRVQLEQSRPWLEEVVTRLAGRKITVGGVEGSGPAPGKAAAAARGAADGDAQSALKQKAMADSGVQAMLDVFRTDIKEVEEI